LGAAALSYAQIGVKPYSDSLSRSHDDLR